MTAMAMRVPDTGARLQASLIVLQLLRIHEHLPRELTDLGQAHESGTIDRELTEAARND